MYFLCTRLVDGCFLLTEFPWGFALTLAEETNHEKLQLPGQKD